MNRMTKRFVLAATTVLSLSAAVSMASAADMAPAPSVYDWSGVYIGLNAGVAWNNSELDGNLECSEPSNLIYCGTFFDPIDDRFRHAVDGDDAVFTGGAMIGANWQWESLVLGLEADVNYANFDASNNREWSGVPLSPEGYVRTRTDLEANWWGTVRGRMGFAADNWLFYGTGGLAWGTIDASAQVDYCFTAACTTGWTARGSESETNVGWTVGAGVEYGWDQWTFGAEYLYVDLGEAEFDHRSELRGLQNLTISGDADVDYQFSVARATLKWKF